METVVGILVALIAIAAIAVGLLFYARKYRLFGHKATAEGVSFENPSYLREQTDPNAAVHQVRQCGFLLQPFWSLSIRLRLSTSHRFDEPGNDPIVTVSPLPRSRARRARGTGTRTE